LISRDLRYLEGITEDLTGWTLRKKKFAHSTSQASQDTLTLCNNGDNFGTEIGTGASQERPSELNEKIEEIENRRESKVDLFTSHASHASQDGLSLCNNGGNFVTQVVTSTSQARHSEPTPNAELISRDLRYLEGITKDLGKIAHLG
jgi:hypothetical protein